MPCNSGQGSGPDYGDIRELKKELSRIEAILCGLIRASSGGPHQAHNLKLLFAKVNWKEAGVTEQEAYAWWSKHLLRDLKQTETT